MKEHKSIYKFAFLMCLIVILLFSKPILFSHQGSIQIIPEKENLHSSLGQFGKYSRNITLSALTPMANYQVKIQLNSSNFDYNHLNSSGSDIRFYDQFHNPLNYWVETWNYGGDSLIWVKIPSIGTSSFRMCYGNTSATSESNGDGVFLLYDDFEGTSLDPAKWTSEGDAYSFIVVSGGLVRIYSDCPSTYWPGLRLGFHDWWKDHGKTYSWHSITGGAFFEPSEDIWLTGEMHWINSTSAPYYENDVFHSNDIDNPDGPLSVRLTTQTTYYGPGTGWGSWITSVDNTLGGPGRTLRLRLWSDRTGIADLKVDWLAVREWSEIEPFATVGPEISQGDPPEINIINPFLNEFFNSIAPDFQISIFGASVNSTWYTIDDGVTNITFSGLTGTINQTEWDKKGDGDIDLRFYVNNTLGNSSYSDVTIKKDTTLPIITIDSPFENEMFGKPAPEFNLTILESNIDLMWYTLDYGVTNITHTLFNETINQSEWNKIGNGTVDIRFYVLDKAGNTAFADVTIRKEISDPIVIINDPLENEVFGIIAPFFDVTVIEPDFNLMWYTLDDGINNVTASGFTGDISQTEWNKQSSGTVIIRFYANDTLGNKGYAERTVEKDVIDPTIQVNTPIDDAVFGDSAPNYDISITDPNLDSMWYTLDNGATNYHLFSLTGIIDQTEWDKKGSGTVPIRFYANDTMGNANYTEVLVIKDLINPIVTIMSPIANYIFGANAPTYEISVTELNLDTMWYTLDDGLTNIPFSSLTGTISQTEWDKESTGDVIIKFYARDSAGNEDYAEIIVGKDISIPLITIITPEIGDSYGLQSPQYYISVIESNVDSMWYTLDNGATTISFTVFTGTIDQSEWDKFGNGAVIIRFYVRDKGDNEAFAEVNVNKDLAILPPSGPNLLPIILISTLIGVFGLIGITLIVFRKRIFSRKVGGRGSPKKSQTDGSKALGSGPMMFCQFCGAKLQKPSKFCIQCGVSLKKLKV